MMWVAEHCLKMVQMIQWVGLNQFSLDYLEMIQMIWVAEHCLKMVQMIQWVGLNQF